MWIAVGVVEGLTASILRVEVLLPYSVRQYMPETTHHVPEDSFILSVHLLVPPC